MADNSKIAWTDATWNPVSGCSKVSEGCRNCYAERDWTRLSKLVPAYAGRAFEDIAFHSDRLDQPLRWKRPRKIFVNSMSDLFHPDVPDAFIAQVFAVMAVCPHHTFQILTKRPERALYLLGAGCMGGFEPAVEDWFAHLGGKELIWPLPNVWLGVSVEDQKTADERIPLLLKTPAALRWTSLEPLIGPVDFGEVPVGMLGPLRPGCAAGLPKVDWVVVGGESGPNARPMEAVWLRRLVAECREARTPLFVKQLGARFSDAKNGIAGPSLALPEEARGLLTRRLTHRSGANVEEWPGDLKVRERPEEKISMKEESA